MAIKRFCLRSAYVGNELLKKRAYQLTGDTVERGGYEHEVDRRQHGDSIVHYKSREGDKSQSGGAFLTNPPRRGQPHPSVWFVRQFIVEDMLCT